jgi:hypothetical protein
MSKVVNIIGSGKTWVDAPMEGENWGITLLPLLRSGFSLVIDMNVYEDGRWGAQQKQEAAVVKQRCEKVGIPYVDLKTYPIFEIMERFDTDYFSNTVDYAIALALYRGYDEINLYGVTLSSHDYVKFKAGVDFWCGYAKGMGVNLKVHGWTTVMKTTDGKMYGYDTPQKGFA